MPFVRQPSLDGAVVSVAVSGAFAACTPAAPVGRGGGPNRTLSCGAGGVSDYALLVAPTQLQSAPGGSVLASVCVARGTTSGGNTSLYWQGT